MCTYIVKLLPILAQLLASANSGRSMTTLYTIKKFDFVINKNYFRDITAFFQPVKGKWGRISINFTVTKQIDMIWLDFNTFRRDEDDKTVFNEMAVKFRVNVCDFAKDGADSIFFKFIDGIYEYMKEMFHPCPVEVGTQFVFADRTIASVPRKGQGPVIPSGYYKLTFDFRNDQNTSLGLVNVEFQYRGY